MGVYSLTLPSLSSGRFVSQLDQPIQIHITPVNNKDPELLNISEAVTYTENEDEALFPYLEVADQDVFCVQPTTLSLANVNLLLGGNDMLVVSLLYYYGIYGPCDTLCDCLPVGNCPLIIQILGDYPFLTEIGCGNNALPASPTVEELYSNTATLYWNVCPSNTLIVLTVRGEASLAQYQVSPTNVIHMQC